jgi:hypothetical protein
MKPITVSVRQVADLTNLSEWSIKQKLRAGKLDAVKAERRTLITFANLERYMASLPKADFTPPTELVSKRAAAALGSSGAAATSKSEAAAKAARARESTRRASARSPPKNRKAARGGGGPS